MRARTRPHARRFLAAGMAGICLLLATPPRAFAQEAEANLWTRWWRGATDRELPAEIPFLFIASIPAMIVITPIWLVQRAYSSLTRDEDDE